MSAKHALSKDSAGKINSVSSGITEISYYKGKPGDNQQCIYSEYCPDDWQRDFTPTTKVDWDYFWLTTPEGVAHCVTADSLMRSGRSREVIPVSVECSLKVNGLEEFKAKVAELSEIQVAAADLVRQEAEAREQQVALLRAQLDVLNSERDGRQKWGYRIRGAFESAFSYARRVTKLVTGAVASAGLAYAAYRTAPILPGDPWLYVGLGAAGLTAPLAFVLGKAGQAPVSRVRNRERLDSRKPEAYCRQVLPDGFYSVESTDPAVGYVAVRSIERLKVNDPLTLHLMPEGPVQHDKLGTVKYRALKL